MEGGGEGSFNPAELFLPLINLDIPKNKRQKYSLLRLSRLTLLSKYVFYLFSFLSFFLILFDMIILVSMLKYKYNKDDIITKFLKKRNTLIYFHRNIWHIRPDMLYKWGKGDKKKRPKTTQRL